MQTYKAARQRNARRFRGSLASELHLIWHPVEDPANCPTNSRLVTRDDEDKVIESFRKTVSTLLHYTVVCQSSCAGTTRHENFFFFFLFQKCNIFSVSSIFKQKQNRRSKWRIYYFSTISIQRYRTDEFKRKATNYCIRFGVARYGPQSVAPATATTAEILRVSPFLALTNRTKQGCLTLTDREDAKMIGISVAILRLNHADVIWKVNVACPTQ